jgi:ParB/RepB/Spo0J family partition protein
MMMTISTAIPLNKLIVSSANVRVVSPSRQADKELMASIASQGVLQNLVVVPAARGKFEVIAGGRRLACINKLAGEGVFDKDYPVPCLQVAKDADVTGISLAENILRLAMHPADQVQAFAKLVQEGKSVADISAAFGVTKKLVTQRLALGRVAPALLDAYRKEAFDLDALRAFTVLCGAAHKQSFLIMSARSHVTRNCGRGASAPSGFGGGCWVSMWWRGRAWARLLGKRPMWRPMGRYQRICSRKKPIFWIRGWWLSWHKRSWQKRRRGL